MTPECDAELRALLRGLDPGLDPARWVFVAVDGPELDDAIMVLREAEGWCAIRPASSVGAPVDAPVFRCITLRVESSLTAVGLTAQVATRLADRGIAANVVAGLWHDHVFVPEADADCALEALRALSREVTD